MPSTIDASEKYIIVVEDSPIDFEITSRALHKANFINDIHHYESGDEAMDFLSTLECPRDSRKFPQLILLDLNIPGTDGKDILMQIKQNDKLKTIPVVILTTSDYEADIKTCYDRGANCYIKKPSKPDEFSEMISSLTSFWQGWCSLPTQFC